MIQALATFFLIGGGLYMAFLCGNPKKAENKGQWVLRLLLSLLMSACGVWLGFFLEVFH